MGNENSVCLSFKVCEKNENVRSPPPVMSSTSLIEEKNLISTQSFKMNSEDLKLSHQDFRRFLLSKIKTKSIGNDEYAEYYELYRSVTKDRLAFESIYWLFSIKWIEFIQTNQNASRGRMFETAVSITSLQNFEKDGLKTNSNTYLRFLVEEICCNNYKITQIMEKFRTTYFRLNQKYLQLEPETLKSLDDKTLELLIQKLLREIKDFLIEPLKDFIIFFYSLAIEKIVFTYMGQDFHDFNLFILDIIHQLTFKFQNRIYNMFSNLLSISCRRKSLLFEENILAKKQEFSLLSLLEGQNFIIPDEILRKAENMYFFENACSKIRSISELRTPFMKFEMISQVQVEILNALLQINETFRLDLDPQKIRNSLDADQLISLYCFVLVKSKNSEICKEIKFLEKFVDDKTAHQTQWGPLYETLRSSVQYILNPETAN